MEGISIKKGICTHYVSLKEHRTNLRRLKQLPQALQRITIFSKQFVGKPQFKIETDGYFVSVIREDFQALVRPLINRKEENYFNRLTVSEWMLDTAYHGHEDRVKQPITMHDVYEQNGVTIKTGNPYRNNAWDEFYCALNARYLGIVEAKSPIGFAFWINDPYGIKNPGKMFYKHIEGADLEQSIGNGNRNQLNWALWEAGKFFSRLLNAHLFLEDSERLGNYFIEENPATKVFRFLDLERVRFMANYSAEKKAEMIAKFIARAKRTGLIDKERLGEFIIVCCGAQSRNIAPLIEKEMTRLETQVLL